MCTTLREEPQVFHRGVRDRAVISHAPDDSADAVSMPESEEHNGCTEVVLVI